MTAKKPQVGRQPVPKLLEFTVTPEILATAVRKDSGHCAASDSVNAQLPGARCETDLATMTLTVRELGVRVEYRTPPIVQAMLTEFDAGREIPSFRFALRRVDAIRVRASRPRDPVTGKQPSGKLPDDVVEKGLNKRRLVKAGATRVASASKREPSKHETPVALLANRRGRKRVFGMRQLPEHRGDA